MKRGLNLKNSLSPVKKHFSAPDIYINTKVHPPFPVRVNRLLDIYNLSEIQLYNYRTNIPPWILKRSHICDQLRNLPSRKYNNPNMLLQETLKHMKSHEEYHPIYTDGSKTSNGVGFAAICNQFKKSSSLPSITTVYTAELFAIKTALVSVKESMFNKVIIYSDSLSAIDAIKSFSSKHPLVLEIQVLIHKLKTRNISVAICWIPAHVGLKGNEEADRVAKEAVSKPCIQRKIPIDDVIAVIKSKVNEKWQGEWNGFPVTNKLRAIKSTTKPWKSTQKLRHHEVILTRLRIGHTNFTHGYLMSTPHEPPPICDRCHCVVSVRHILAECPKYATQRSIFNNQSFTNILADGDNFSFSNILSFLKTSLLLNKI